ncbi:MAG: class I SAM-dependent methyltransferase [Candidatus Eremiobacteraeota bacterium]|nr:class I SAM-dependent methyltransferase [Candidatus Eremiobacteraeota bacterium]
MVAEKYTQAFSLQASLKHYYSIHSLFYDLSRPLFLFERERAARRIRVPEGGTVMEVGCGTGFNLDTLVQAAGPSGHVIALDLSPSMLAVARRKAGRRKWLTLSLVEGDAADFTPARKADAILFSYSLSMIGNWKKALDKCLCSLREGGQLVVLDFYRWEVLRSLYPLWEKWLSLNHVHIPEEPLRYLMERAGSSCLSIYRKGYNCILEATL